MQKAYIQELDRLRPYLTEKFLGWIYEQRSLHLTNARHLLSEEKSQLDKYFEKRILDLVWVTNVQEISNPTFYDELTKLGLPIPLDFTNAVGLTLMDCILIRKELWLNPPLAISTLFHELVHVVQIDIVGLRKHVELYADGLIQNELKNDDILLERQAYSLSERFSKKEPAFAVSDIVNLDLARYK